MLVVDHCDLASGEVVHVRARGLGEIVPIDRDRALRKFARYHGPDQSTWDRRFALSLEFPSTRMCRLLPESIEAADVSFVVATKSAKEGP